MIYHKHYIPLESNPILFTQLIHHLGVSPSLAFHDVLSIDDPELLAFIPRPALALILVFPTSPSYEAFKAEEEAVREEYDGSGKNEAVMWYKQTINNACGLYAILHAVSNEDSRKFIRECINFSPQSLSDQDIHLNRNKPVALRENIILTRHTILNPKSPTRIYLILSRAARL